MTTLIENTVCVAPDHKAGEPLKSSQRQPKARTKVPGRNGFIRRLVRSVARGLSIAIPVLLLTSFFTFLLGVWADQEPAAIMLGEAATRDDVARLEAELGLDRPVIVQYFTWLASAVQGDLGVSWFTGIPVVDSVAQRFPVSLSIAAFALVIALVLGGIAGSAAALTRGSVIDRFVTLVSSTIATMPPFVIGIALIVLFGVYIPLFPTGGYVSPEIGTALWISSITLPAIALSLDAAADLARQLRTGLVGTLGENYIIGAKLRGLSPRRVLVTHALRNGVGPAVAALGLQIPRLIGGAVIMEAVFSIPGLGQLARDGAMRGDVPVVIGSLLVTVVLVLIASVAVNALLGVLKPDTRRTV